MSLRMLKAVPPVTASVLSVAFLPEFCWLHVNHVTDGFMQSVPILIPTIFATSTMWNVCVYDCLILTDHSCHPNTHVFQFHLCNGATLDLTMQLTFSRIAPLP